MKSSARYLFGAVGLLSLACTQTLAATILHAGRLIDGKSDGKGSSVAFSMREKSNPLRMVRTLSREVAVLRKKFRVASSEMQVTMLVDETRKRSSRWTLLRFTSTL